MMGGIRGVGKGGVVGVQGCFREREGGGGGGGGDVEFKV